MYADTLRAHINTLAHSHKMPIYDCNLLRIKQGKKEKLVSQSHPSTQNACVCDGVKIHASTHMCVSQRPLQSPITLPSFFRTHKPPLPCAREESEQKTRLHRKQRIAVMPPSDLRLPSAVLHGVTAPLPESSPPPLLVPLRRSRRRRCWWWW